MTTLKTNRDRTYNYEYDGEGDRVHEEKIINSPYDLDYKQDTEEWFDYMQSLPFTEVEELLEAKKSDESFDAMRYQLTYRRKNGLCASNLIKDPKSNEKCEYKDYLLDKTVENTLVLSENDDIHIYGEERISTENTDGTRTYLSGNNQSVMTEISSKGTMSQIEYDDFGKTDDKTSGYGYDGEKLDTTGNIYLRARYYNPRIGQFIQIDDYKGTQDNLTSQNRYTYCLNNQYKYMDPSGNSITVALLGLTAYELAKYLAIGFVIVGGVLAIKQATTKKSTARSTKGIIKPVKDILKKGKKATKNLKNTIAKKVAKKVKPKKVIQAVTKAIAPAIPVGIKALKSTLTIPQPCPWDKVPNIKDLPNDILSLISSVGLTFVATGIYERINIDKKYKWSKENHHMIPKDDNYSNTHGSLEAIREKLRQKQINPRTDRRNIVRIHTAIHKTTLSRVYKNGIIRAFGGLECSEILVKLRTLRVIFRAIDNNLYPFDRVPTSHIYY